MTLLFVTQFLHKILEKLYYEKTTLVSYLSIIILVAKFGMQFAT